MENPLALHLQAGAAVCDWNDAPARGISSHLHGPRWQDSLCLASYWGVKKGVQHLEHGQLGGARWCHLRLDRAWTLWAFHLGMDIWTARQCSSSQISPLPCTRITHLFPQRWLISNPFLLLHLLSLCSRLVHPTSQSVSSAQTVEIPTQKLERNSEREILCVRVVG